MEADRNPNMNIVSNTFIKHPKFRYLNPTDFLTPLLDTLLFLDESYRLIDNRRSMSSSNVNLSQVKEQRRKTNTTWFITAQHFNLIDKRFEMFANILITCKPRFPIGTSKEDFNYRIRYLDLHKSKVIRIKYNDAKRFFTLFDTKEIVEVQNKQKLEFDFYRQHPDLMLKKVVELKNKFWNDFKDEKITLRYVKGVLLENEIIFQYAELLYTHLLYNEKISKREK